MLVLPELVLSGLWDRVAMSIGVGVHGNSEGEQRYNVIQEDNTKPEKKQMIHSAYK